MTLVLPAINAAAPSNGERTRWGVSLLVAVTLHAMGAVSLLHWRDNVKMVEPPPAMTMIDLAPLPTPPAPPVVQPPPEPPVQQHVEPPKPVVVQKVIPKLAPRPAVTRPTPPQVQQQSPPPTAAAPAPTPAPTPVQTSNAIPTFRDLIAGQLQRYKRYPALSQKRGEQGVPLLRFTLDRRGNVIDARLDRSSGHPLLDQEVMDLVHRAAPFPPIPADISSDTLTLIVPVDFNLR